MDIFNFLLNDREREPFYIIGCGMNGVGKSHFAKYVMEMMAPQVPRQIVIPSGPMDDTWHHLPLFPVETILEDCTGLYLHDLQQLSSSRMATERETFFYELGVALNRIDRPYRYPVTSKQRLLFDALVHPTYGLMNALLICDDFKKYLTSYNEDDDVMALLGDRRHRDLDLIFMCHDPSEIPRYFLRKNPQLVLWATSGNFDSAGAKIKPDVMRRLLDAQTRINEKNAQGKRLDDVRLRGYCEPIAIETEGE